MSNDQEEQLGGPSRGRDGPVFAPAAVLDALPDSVVAAARDGRIMFVNVRAEELFGYSRRELVGRPVEVLWPERVRARYIRNMELYFAEEHPLRFSTEAWGLRRDGSEFTGEMTWGIVQTRGGPILLAVGRDISQRRAAEARTRAVAAMGERALAGADSVSLAREAVQLLGIELPLIGAEARLTDGTSLASLGATADPDLRLDVGSDVELLVAPERALTADETDVLHAVADTFTSALARLHDQERVRYQAVHDPLTGLPNRTLLHDRLDRALARAERNGSHTGVLFIDLDNFKDVNDVHGHAAGDAVLVMLSGRLRTALRPADTVARFGGDEFVVVAEEIDEEAAMALGSRLQRTIQKPLRVDALEHWLTASIGIAVGQSEADVLIGHADAAVYRAKARGHGQIEFFGY